jgi:hypothetical protein
VKAFGLDENLSYNGSCITLPSSEAALTLVRGDVVPGIVGVVTTSLVRAAIIMGGLYVVGERDHLVRNALGAAVAVEAFVLAWVAKNNADAQSTQTRSA